MKPRDPRSRRRGFTHAGGLLSQRIRQAGHSRGFAETRLLTQWTTIVGPEIAETVQPVKVSYAKSGIGATLTVAVEGARAPEVQMQLPAIRNRVNSCYGYNAISRIRIVHAEPVGFAEQQSAFDGPKAPEPEPDPATVSQLGLDNVKDTRLRVALESLTKNVLTKGKPGRPKR